MNWPAPLDGILPSWLIGSPYDSRLLPFMSEAEIREAMSPRSNTKELSMCEPKRDTSTVGKILDQVIKCVAHLGSIQRDGIEAGHANNRMFDRLTEIRDELREHRLERQAAAQITSDAAAAKWGQPNYGPKTGGGVMTAAREPELGRCEIEGEEVGRVDRATTVWQLSDEGIKQLAPTAFARLHSMVMAEAARRILNDRR